jgi:hypothetical protein
MRSSSVKTLAVAVTLAFTVLTAAPSADARPAQPKRATQTRKDTRVSTVQTFVRLMLQRFGINVNGLPSDPIPGQNDDGENLTGLPSDPIPTLPEK